MIEIAVIGGGMAGLAAAWRLHRRRRDVHLFDAGARVGGFVDTVRTDEGFLVERGPGSIRGGRLAMKSLIREVGLEDALLLAEPAAKNRYIWAGGEIQRLPSGPKDLLTTKLLSPGGKLRLLSEPLRRAPRGRRDETLGALLERRIGPEAVASFVDPFVTGVYAGDPYRLGVDAMPLVGELEHDHGGLFRGLGKKRGAFGSGIYSLTDGLGMLPGAIGRALGERVHLGASAVALERIDGGTRVVLRDADPIDARRVILAAPAPVTGALLATLGVPAQCLTHLPHAPIVKVELGLRDADLARPLDGFGLLTASSSPLPGDALPIMGVIFASTVFSGRAPAGHRSLSVMLGGVRDTGVVERDDAALVAQAERAIDLLFGLRAAPVMRRVTRWPAAIPQYPPGHLRAIASLGARLPVGVRLAGNHQAGVSLDDVVASGLSAADAI